MQVRSPNEQSTIDQAVLSHILNTSFTEESFINSTTCSSAVGHSSTANISTISSISIIAPQTLTLLNCSSNLNFGEASTLPVKLLRTSTLYLRNETQGFKTQGIF